MALTDLACKNAPQKDKTYKLTDGEGLFLEVTPKGTKYWRYRYSFYGKDKVLSLGGYPTISLLDARKSRDNAQAQLLQGLDPALVKQETQRLEKYKHAQTLELITREWHAHFYDTWEPKTASMILRRFELYIFPCAGHIPVEKITPQIMLTALQRAEKRSSDVAERLLKHSSRVFEYAEFTRGIKNNPTTGLKRHLKKYKKGHHASIDIDELPDLLAAINGNQQRLYRQTILAMRLLMLTAVRTTELRMSKWAEINFEKALWTIPAARMKMKEEHLVPLSKQAVQILLELKEMNGTRDYVFTGQYSRKKPMSQSTIIQALKRMKYQDKMTGHGFRTLFMGVSKEKLGYAHDIPDRQLAHAPKGTNGKAYDRAKFLPQRTQLMQDYADYIDQQQQSPSQERTVNVSPSVTIRQPTNYNPTSINGGIRYTITGLGQYSNTLPPSKEGSIFQTSERPRLTAQLLDDDGCTSVH